MRANDTSPRPDEEDTQPESFEDIGELPTLRWVRIVDKAEESPRR
jgi:hypothetical protein